MSATPEESAGQMLVRIGTDARLWTEELVKRFNSGETGDSRSVLVDEGTMLGWFANAIETGRSAGQAHPVNPDAAGLVFEALGAASVCWIDDPEEGRVFDSTRCANIGRKLLTDLGYSIPPGYEDRSDE